MGLVDHTWTRRPKEAISEQCHAKFIDNTTTNCGQCCDASAESTEISRKHVGRATIPIPIIIEYGINNWKEFPSDYPNTVLQNPMGYIFHFPVEARCKVGASVGDDGCTWQIAPTVHILQLSFADAVALFNVNISQDSVTKRVTIPATSSLENIDNFKKVIVDPTLMPVGLPECGASASRTGAARPQQTIV